MLREYIWVLFGQAAIGFIVSHQNDVISFAISSDALGAKCRFLVLMGVVHRSPEEIFRNMDARSVTTAVLPEPNF